MKDIITYREENKRLRLVNAKLLEALELALTRAYAEDVPNLIVCRACGRQKPMHSIGCMVEKCERALAIAKAVKK